MRRSLRFGPTSRLTGFTLVELLVVIGIIALLVGILLPALSKARQVSMRIKCLANIRSLCLAQAAYANSNKDMLIAAGEGSTNVQGSWIGALEGAYSTALARRCPSDECKFFDQPLPGSTPPAFRTTSYAINNYVSPTHIPSGATRYVKVGQVPRSSSVIQFAELGEAAEVAGSDHIHVQDFYLAFAPTLTLGLVAKQMPLGRHGGGKMGWDAVLNYGFLDGHAESLRLDQVYTNPSRNRFDPSAMP